MPELRIQTDHNSLSVLENAIQDYNFNTALRAVPPGILALAVLSWLNPMIPVAIAIVAAFAMGIWLGIDGHPAVSQLASPTLPAPLLPPPPPSSGQGPPFARGPPTDHGSPYKPNYPSDQNPSIRPSSFRRPALHHPCLHQKQGSSRLLNRHHHVPTAAVPALIGIASATINKRD